MTTVQSDVYPSTRTPVASYAIRDPKTTPLSATVQDMWELFSDDHVHMALVTRGRRLLGCVVRADLAGAPPTAPALSVASTRDRTISAQVSIDAAWELLTRTGTRRLAVVDDADRLEGLLCLKRSRAGYCSDADVNARAEERGTCTDDPVNRARTDSA